MFLHGAATQTCCCKQPGAAMRASPTRAIATRRPEARSAQSPEDGLRPVLDWLTRRQPAAQPACGLWDSRAPELHTHCGHTPLPAGRLAHAQGVLCSAGALQVPGGASAACAVSRWRGPGVGVACRDRALCLQGWPRLQTPHAQPRNSALASTHSQRDKLRLGAVRQADCMQGMGLRVTQQRKCSAWHAVLASSQLSPCAGRSGQAAHDASACCTARPCGCCCKPQLLLLAPHLIKHTLNCGRLSACAL